MEFSVPFFGSRYFGNKNNFIDWNVFYYGVYGRSEIGLIRKILSGISKPTYIDVGANVGHHVLAVAELCGKVIAFEPFGPVRLKLEEKIEKNNLRGVRVFPYGLSSGRGLLPFSEPVGRNLGTGSFCSSSEIGERLMLPVVAGDDALEHLMLPSIDFIKIDVEGAEEDVLRGLRNTLHRYQPIVLFETLRNNLVNDGVRLLELFPSGYAIYAVQFARQRWLVFSDDGWSLSPLGHADLDGYLLAIPIRFAQMQMFRIPRMAV